jgi:hypothetical protein
VEKFTPTDYVVGVLMWLAVMFLVGVLSLL